MEKEIFIPEIPYEKLLRNMCGDDWRHLSPPEIDAAWGMAIVQSVLDGVKPDVSEISLHLGIEERLLYDAYQRLVLNRVFKKGVLDSDRKLLEDGDVIAWGYYGGYASGATGVASYAKVCP